MSQKPYKASSPAVHAARVLFRNFEFRELADTAATEHNVAIIVDVCTQVFRVAPAMRQIIHLAPWHDPEAVAGSLERLRDMVRDLQTVREGMPSFTGQVSGPQSLGPDGLLAKGYVVSAPATCAARSLMTRFTLTPRASIQATENNVATLIDVCTEIFRVQEAVDNLVSQTMTGTQEDATRNLDQIRKALRLFEVVYNRLPSYRPNEIAVTIRAAGSRSEPHLTRKQQEKVQTIVTEVKAARTVEEQQAVLRKAGLVNYPSQ